MTLAEIIGLIVSTAPFLEDELSKLLKALIAGHFAHERREFLEQCVDLVRAIRDSNPTLSLEDKRRWCLDAIEVYAARMGQAIPSREELASIGVIVGG